MLSEYPEMKQTLETVALERLSKIGVTPPPRLSTDASLVSDQSLDGVSQLAPRPPHQSKVTFSDTVDSTQRRCSEPNSPMCTCASVELHPTNFRKMSLLTTGRRMTVDKDPHLCSLQPGVLATCQQSHPCSTDPEVEETTSLPHPLSKSPRRSKPMSLPPLAEDSFALPDTRL
jgi:hypothetical protein